MSSDGPRRVLLADDHAIVRRGLRFVLDAEPDLEVVLEAGDGAQAVAKGLADEVDLAVLDVSVLRMTGVQAAGELSRRRPELRLLMLSMHDNEQYFVEGLKSGGAHATGSAAASSRRRAGAADAFYLRGFVLPWPIAAASAVSPLQLRSVRILASSACHSSVLDPKSGDVPVVSSRSQRATPRTSTVPERRRAAIASSSGPA